MALRPAAVAPDVANCKCCGTPAALYGVVDFNKNCELPRNPTLLALSGIPVYYHRCPQCGFIFTVAFDEFSEEDFARDIYNSSYILVDPDFLERRPTSNAQTMASIFGENKHLEILDYGGGNGATAALLQNAGYVKVKTYDPYSENFRAKPQQRFDCVFSFEVLEHTVNPRQTIQEIAAFLNSNGVILFSTLLQPDEIDQIGVNWWYIGPRNGHVSIHTSASLQALAASVDMRVGHFNANFHMLFESLPDWASAVLQVKE